MFYHLWLSMLVKASSRPFQVEFAIEKVEL